MALGFKDCCNEYNYFYMNGVPGTVSVGQFYYVVTNRNLEFCAQYVEVPQTNYKVPTYTLREMTQQSSCQDCFLVNPCPLEVDLEFSTYNANSVGEIGNVGIITIIPMSVSCSPSVNPTVSGTTGQVRLSIQGGTPPYNVYSSQTQNLLISCNQTNNVLIYNNAKLGVYNLRVEDSNKDYVYEIKCEIIKPPEPLLISSTQIKPTIYGKDDGTITLVPSGGTSPFFYTFSGITYEEVSTKTFNGLTAGVYNFGVVDSGVGIYSQNKNLSVTLLNPEQIVYPDDLCFSFNFCEQYYQLNFENTGGTYNYRPTYNCTNPNTISASTIQMKWGISDIFTGWVIDRFEHDSFRVPSNCTLKSFAEFRQTTKQEQPTGSWVCSNGTFLNTSIDCVSGTCQSKMLIDVSTQNACTKNNLFGSIIISRVGGTPPFYYHYGNNIVNYPTINNVLPGSYLVYVADNNGNVSDYKTVIIQDTTAVDILPPNNITYNHTQSITIKPQSSLDVSLTNILFNLSIPEDGIIVSADLQVTVLLQYPHISGNTNSTFAEFQQSEIENLSEFSIGGTQYTLSSPTILNISGTTCECGKSNFLQTNLRQYFYNIPVEFNYSNSSLSGNVYTNFIYDSNNLSTCTDLNQFKSVLKYRVELNNITFNTGCLSLGDTTNNFVENYWVISNQTNYGMTLSDYGTTNPNIQNTQLC